ncbi:MAG TPA: RNA 2',3'-cyclic phosphodiesterase, partial [Candidatus Pacearchaeota archaeon]|nr:RNA 2',3'-cyclic phosphodiesterase [Candidatus Pacearchaeota archaeon]HOK94307.1 RNA 2',3'-cyclic phosphodiesterase [Candidatus Pacearchaeota archaeon]HPO75337.1 RNA 2',3'-cyclic phosphodiesterase [Candidatus Pacearchaeota archaeon]
MPRLFIAALIPKEIKEELLSKKLQKKFGENLRWTPPQNLHLTLAFLGWTEEKDLVKIKDILKETTNKNFSPFFLNLTKISLGPDPKKPRLVWAEGKVNNEFLNFVEKLKQELKSAGIFIDEKYSFLPHLTLARAKGKELSGKKTEEKIDLTFRVKEIALMESKLKREGAEYKILESAF